MIVSLNEIEVMARRACRGVGYPWGIAEEAGRAVRWLAAHGLDGPQHLATLLTDEDDAGSNQPAPAFVDGELQAPTGRLSPLIAGAALCDRAGVIAAGAELRLAATAHPLLLVPYAAAAVSLSGDAFELAWGNAKVIVAPAGIAIEGEEAALNAPHVEYAICRPAGAFGAPLSPPAVRARRVSSTLWSRLSALAERTFAPPSEASRLAGAGAGLTDND